MTTLTSYTVYDKTTGDEMCGYHEAAGIFEFCRPGRYTASQLGVSMGEMVEILGRITRATGRRLGVRES